MSPPQTNNNDNANGGKDGSSRSRSRSRSSSSSSNGVNHASPSSSAATSTTTTSTWMPLSSLPDGDDSNDDSNNDDSQESENSSGGSNNNIKVIEKDDDDNNKTNETDSATKQQQYCYPGDDSVAAAVPRGKKQLHQKQVVILPVTESSSSSWWRVGLNQKASPQCIDSWISLSLTLDGRDKMTKWLQYMGRLLAWLLLSNENQNESRRWLAFSKQLSASRKAFRLGRSIVELQKLRKMGIVCSLYHSLGAVRQRGNNNHDDKGNKTLNWKSIGSALKVMGLLGFWTADNVSFLAAAGMLDDYTRLKDQTSAAASITNKANRQSWQRSCLLVANRSYFGGSVAGLYTNFWIYWTYRHHDVMEAHQRVQQLCLQQRQVLQTHEDDDDGNTKGNSATTNDEDKKGSSTTLDTQELTAAKERLQRVQEKQLTLFLALVKSCCDVMVFANNTGIDLFQKFCGGRKLNEGIHCLGGMTSAAVILYNNYPNAKRNGAANNSESS
eukprot:CAMPEP_0119007874 /NCGR_PEP_ID=MMETSP1176-20130426/3313_1 /TAXON_ID=265551 /ORGANISM="Synedropsis recta cf, Strain CCMP1620" /LENGTH=497 /DNA_ID=CAMNT_0006960107 /DNA_START=68 /DNA_END=1558 /DNA_ORIENTATION=+